MAESKIDGDVTSATLEPSSVGLTWPLEDVQVQLALPLGSVEWARGPHSRSNWLPIGWPRSRFCAGGWPFQLPAGYGFRRDETEDMATDKVRCMLTSGITTFVNLTQEDEIPISGSYDTWMEKVQDVEMSLHGEQARTRLRFDILCEMPDGSVVFDAELATLLERILDELNDSSRMLYVHCYGGHGRTGVVACSLLCLLYPSEMLRQIPDLLKEEWARKNIKRHLPQQDKYAPEFWDTAEGAVTVFNRFHAERENEEGGGFCRFPHSAQQIEQVVRVAQRAGPFAKFASC